MSWSSPRRPLSSPIDCSEMSFKFCASITVEKHDVRQAEAELVFFNEPPLIVEDVRRWQADHLHSEAFVSSQAVLAVESS